MGISCYDEGHVNTNALDLSCQVRKEGSPTNPTISGPADVNIVRKLHNSGEITLPGGAKVNHWGFEGPNGERPLPSPPIIVEAGKLVRVKLESTMSVHTIHFHGIEPEDCNDGVGHTSWEVSGHYTYQWRAKFPGTYFYHCHVNTTLHFHMGLWGGLIVRPPSIGDGKKHVFEEGPGLPSSVYDVEAVWPFHGIDTSWREINHAAGLCSLDEFPGLNDYNPTYFLINGAPKGPALTDTTRAAVHTTVGKVVLARITNADYYPLHVDFDGLEGEVIGADGRRLPESFKATSLDLTSAERYDVLFRPPGVGEWDIKGTFGHWVNTSTVVGDVTTRIKVT